MQKTITKTQIGWITGSVVWLNVSLNRLLVAMENLYWLSVSVNSSGGDRASLGFETVHLGSATRPRLAVHCLCISKGVVVLVHCHTFLHCIFTICFALYSTWSPSAHCALFHFVLCISLLSIMHFPLCIVYFTFCYFVLCIFPFCSYSSWPTTPSAHCARANDKLLSFSEATTNCYLWVK